MLKSGMPSLFAHCSTRLIESEY